MSPPPLDPAFRSYLLGIVDVAERDLDKLVAELMDYWSQPMEDWIVRRHRELQREGVKCRHAYGRIRSELPARRFRSPPLSERQIRRILYG